MEEEPKRDKYENAFIITGLIFVIRAAMVAGGR